MADIETVYRLYFRDVYRYIFALCRDQHLAEDIVSETFFSALKALDGFQGQCDIRVWLCQIAKNRYFSYLRKQKRLLLTDPGTTPFQQETPGPENLLTEAADSPRIRQALHNLKEPYKEVFLLRALGELDFRQIGELFGKSQNWACVTFHRAKKQIRSQLEDES